MSTTGKLITAEELLAMGDIGRCELIYGELVMMSPSGFEHSRITARIARLLDVWNEERRLGTVLGAEAGFRLARNPDLVRAPDAAFVLAERVGDELRLGFFEGAPDLAVEVISPSDAWPDVEAKIDTWLAHGCQSCWVIDPRNRQVTVYRANGQVVKLKEPQQLEDPVTPGFCVGVEKIFAK